MVAIAGAIDVDRGEGAVVGQVLETLIGIDIGRQPSRETPRD